MVPIGAEDSSSSESPKAPAARYRTPRVALIVVLPENHVVSAEHLAERLSAHGDQQVDVVIACAGQPANLAALHQSVGNAQFLLAPAGTSTADLRELAMRQVPGDIVTLLSGTPMSEAGVNSELFMTS
jgi:phosphoribosylcarboxyaminoimidazole (NCAIR) mutase